MVRRSEVWWYRHPYKAPRPFIVLTRSTAASVLNQVLAVPTTKTIRGIPTEVELGPADGLPRECVAALDNAALIRTEFCTDRIVTLSSTKMREICAALATATDC